VTAQEADTIAFHGSRVKGSHIRGSEFSHYWRAVGARRSLRLNGTVQNLCAKSLVGQVFDGVKMDIEGSEGPILDYGWLPRCDKLVLEYHSSIDTSLAKLASRLAFLKSRFHHVAYPPEYDLAIESGAKEHKGYFDRNIFAMGWK
jgi:hypothetical protein